MSIAWSEMETEIRDLLDSDQFEEGGKMHKYLLKWANRTVRDICQEIDIEEHLQTCQITFTTSDTYKTLPSIFFKVSDRYTKVRISGTTDDEYIPIVDLATLKSYDPDRDETASLPNCVSIVGNKIHVYPLFSGTLILEDYFRTPTDMADSSGNPDLTDDAVVQDLIQAGVMRRAYRWLQDYDEMKLAAMEWNYNLDLYRIHLDKSTARYTDKSSYY